MNFQITIQTDNVERLGTLAALLQQHGFSATPRTPSVEPTPEVAAPKKLRKAVEKVEAAPIPNTSVLDYKAVAEATMALSRSQGREAVVKLLAEYAVDHANKLMQEDWAGYVAKADKLSAQPKAEAVV